MICILSTSLASVSIFSVWCYSRYLQYRSALFSRCSSKKLLQYRKICSTFHVMYTWRPQSLRFYISVIDKTKRPQHSWIIWIFLNDFAIYVPVVYMAGMWWFGCGRHPLQGLLEGVGPGNRDFFIFGPWNGSEQRHKKTGTVILCTVHEFLYSVFCILYSCIVCILCSASTFSTVTFHIVLCTEQLRNRQRYGMCIR